MQLNKYVKFLKYASLPYFPPPVCQRYLSNEIRDKDRSYFYFHRCQNNHLPCLLHPARSLTLLVQEVQGKEQQ